MLPLVTSRRGTIALHVAPEVSVLHKGDSSRLHDVPQEVHTRSFLREIKQIAQTKQQVMLLTNCFLCKASR